MKRSVLATLIMKSEKSKNRCFIITLEFRGDLCFAGSLVMVFLRRRDGFEVFYRPGLFC